MVTTVIAPFVSLAYSGNSTTSSLEIGLVLAFPVPAGAMMLT